MHLAKTFSLEFMVPYSQHLVDNKDVRFQMRGDRKCKPDIHPGTVPLHRCVQELLDSCKLNNIIKAAANLGARHTEDSTVQVDILAPGELGMKTGADLEQARDTTLEND